MSSFEEENIRGSKEPGPRKESAPKLGYPRPRHRRRRKLRVGTEHPTVAGPGLGRADGPRPLCSGFYQSHVGLASPPIPPLFHHPVGLLANNTQLVWIGESILPGSSSRIVPMIYEQVAGVPQVSQFALWESDLLRVAASQDTESRHRKKFFAKYRVLSFMRATWDAVLLSFQAVRAQRREDGLSFSLCSNQRRMLTRFKHLLVAKPVEAALFAKGIFTEARTWFYGGSYPAHKLARFERKKDALIFSYGKRALPPPPKDDSLLPEFVSRITGPAKEEVPGWRPFIQEFLDKRKPPQAPNLWTQPTSHSVLGYPRKTGGMVKAVADLVCIGKCLMKGELTSSPITLLRKLGAPHPVFDRNNLSWAAEQLTATEPLKALERLSGSQQLHQEALWRGVQFTLDRIEVIPILPLYAEERGLKVRYPTTTLVAANLIYQVLRRAVDSYLIREPMVSRGMGGKRDIDLSLYEGPWYSADMTKATDHHPFWLTRTVYEEVVRRDTRLEVYLPYFDKLFGPKKILSGQSSDYTLLQPDFNPSSVSPLKRLFRADGPEWGEATRFFVRYTMYLDRLNNAEGVMSTQGAMMGDATSFPIMPLVSMYGMAKSGISHGKLTGDDALLAECTLDKRQAFDRAVASLGANPSDKVGYMHEEWGLFCEEPYRRGVPVPFYPTSIWNAPPGGSKSQCSWFNQSITAHDFNVWRGWSKRKGLHKYSPYYRYIHAAFHLGLPVREELALGGILAWGYPHVSKTYHQSWLAKLASLGIAEVNLGTGLNPIPSGLSSEVRQLGVSSVRQLIAEDKSLRVLRGLVERNDPSVTGVDLASVPLPAITEEGLYRTYSSLTRTRVTEHIPYIPKVRIPILVPNVDLQEYSLRLTASASAWEFYWRAPIDPDDIKHPSLRMVCEKFYRAVRYSKPRWGHYANVKADLDSKRRRFVVKSRVPGIPPRFYGLEGVAEPELRHNDPLGHVRW